MARTEPMICAETSANEVATASVRRLELAASPRAAVQAATIPLIADDCSCEAPAASSAPPAICSIERPSCLVAAAACARPLASSSVAAAMRSEAVAWREGLAPCLPAEGLSLGVTGVADFAAALKTAGLAAPVDILDFLTSAM